jgi:pimeloyl-ACP methyl ester carboxylesterase
VGWGFTDHAWITQRPDQVISPDSKRQHLKAFIEQHLKGRPVVFVGASVGGAIAMDFTLHYPDLVSKLCLLGRFQRRGSARREESQRRGMLSLLQKHLSANLQITFSPATYLSPAFSL